MDFLPADLPANAFVDWLPAFEHLLLRRIREPVRQSVSFVCSRRHHQHHHRHQHYSHLYYYLLLHFILFMTYQRKFSFQRKNGVTGQRF